MFNEKDFAIFEIEGLDRRMGAIRSDIQPKFRKLGAYFKCHLDEALGEELPIHIAQHLRRTTHAPEDTWMALGGNKRGYKKFPHFQLGIFKTHLFIWLAFIDNPQHEKEMAAACLENLTLFDALPEDFVVSFDHHYPDVLPLKDCDLVRGLERWRDVKKGEFLVGRTIMADDPILKDEEAARAFMLATYQQLIPIYQLAFSAYPS